MTTVKYTEKLQDVRILAAADLAKAGVEEFTKTRFKQGEEVEVSEEVAQALVGNPDLFGQFELAGEDAKAEAEEEAPKVAVKKASTGSASTTTTTPVTGGQTGNASTK